MATWTEKAKPNSTVVNANNYDEWNKQVKAQESALKAQGKNVTGDYDANGAYHISTKGQSGLNNVLNYYNTNSNPTYNVNGKTYKVTSATETPKLSSGTAATLAADDVAEDAYKTAVEKASAPYEEAKQDAISALNTQYNTSANQLANIYNQQKALADEDADDAARQQYILYKQNKNKLGEQLSTAGITGGASETALNSILNAYSQGLATNEAARQDALTELGNTYQNDLSNLQATLQGNMADINNQYGKAIAQVKADAVEDAQTAYEAAQKQNEVTEWNNKVLNTIQEKNPKYTWVDSDGKYHWSNNETTANSAKAAGNKVVTRSGVTNSTAEWNESVSKKIASVNPKYTWTDSDGKLHWSNNQSTANIAKANGYKVATRTDAKTTKASSTTKKKVVKSDDSSKSDDNPFGGSSTSVAKSIPSTILENTAAARYGNSTYGQKTASTGVTQALSYIKKQYQNKKITEKQANYLIDKYATS